MFDTSFPLPFLSQLHALVLHAAAVAPFLRKLVRGVGDDARARHGVTIELSYLCSIDTIHVTLSGAARTVLNVVSDSLARACPGNMPDSPRGRRGSGGRDERRWRRCEAGGGPAVAFPRTRALDGVEPRDMMTLFVQFNPNHEPLQRFFSFLGTPSCPSLLTPEFSPPDVTQQQQEATSCLSLLLRVSTAAPRYPTSRRHQGAPGR